MYVQGSRRYCTTSFQLEVEEGAPELALDCPSCIWGIVNCSTWFQKQDGKEFVADRRAEKFLRGGIDGWFEESLI